MSVVDKNKLIASIDEKVYQNAAGKVTGQRLQDTLHEMVEAIATPVNDNEGQLQGIQTDVNANSIAITQNTTNIGKNAQDISKNVQDISKNRQDIATKQNKADAVGKKTAEGGEIFNGATSAGNLAHAEGSSTTASGKAAHAEGNNGTAYGDASHTEGTSSSPVTEQTLIKDNNGIFTDWIKSKFSLAKSQSSHVEGRDCLSLDINSHSEGLESIAYGAHSHAEGNSRTYESFAHSEGWATASAGLASHVEGNSSTNIPVDLIAQDITEIEKIWETKKFTLAKGIASHAEGQDCLALGDNSHAEGYYCRATGRYAHSEGVNSKSNGVGSHSEGSNTIANGVGSHSEGELTSANGRVSHASNNNTVAFNYASTAIGTFNKPQKGSSTAYVASNDLFEIGNGTSDGARGNAFVVTGEGNVKADGTYTSPAGDYAEMFEWKDGNKKGEDRVGYIVAIDGEKIIKANGNEHIGIVSAKPSILGDNPMRWAKKYATDEWGRVILEDVEVKYTENEEIPSEERDAMVEAEFNARMAKAEPIAEEGLTEEEIAMAKEMQKEQIRMEAESAVPYTREVEKTRTDTVQKLNPDYNPELDFVPRTDRSEWSAVGMMGKLLVRQDGTLKAGSRCSAKNGVATYNAKGSIYVMKVISESQALVLVK